jgi:hypothetical protein
MKTTIAFGLALLLLGCTRQSSTQGSDSAPALPKATEVHAAFTDDDMYGPSKDSSEIFGSASEILSALGEATYLGRNLEIDDAPWRGSSEYFNQRWTIVTMDKKGVRICAFESIHDSSKKRFCYIDYFDEDTHTRGGMRHSYYYQLKSRK